MREEEAIVLVLFMVIVAGAGLLYGALVNQRKIREMAHRERLAMIERGLLPSPELDPARFEASTRPLTAPSTSAIRYRTAGVLLVGFGLGLAVLIMFTAHAPALAAGVGGPWIVLGGASLVNYALISRERDARATSPQWTPPPSRPEPPTNIAP